jgi:RHS repeat-associated protein
LSNPRTAAGLSSWNYFDGLGRTTVAKQTGPDAKVTRVDTAYNNLGQVTSTTLPYFDGGASIGATTYAYDDIGRQSKVTAADGTSTQSCYGTWFTVSIDGNGHMRRTNVDAHGRIQWVQEYKEIVQGCSANYLPSFTFTSYWYDALDNLTSISPNSGFSVTMDYDRLSRKTMMTDPDMGVWQYVYDAAGNLTKQTDTKGQVVYFQYDVLNRLRQKDYGTQKALGSGDVRYTYDTAVSGYYQIGRLYEVGDVSGTTRFYYDNMGRVAKTDKIVDGVTYTTKNTYDLAGRVSSVTYPSGDLVNYAYNGPVLQQVYKDAATSYARYEGHNALGQPATVRYGNGVTTAYTYANTANTLCPRQNFRLCQIMTTVPGATHQSVRYAYDNGGNVTGITDSRPTGGMHTSQTQTFGYDVLDRLVSAQGAYGPIVYAYDIAGNMLCNSALSPCSETSPNYKYQSPGHGHAVSEAAGVSYLYDANGNMTKRGSDALTYDYENRLTAYAGAAGTTSFVYDGDGGRVKKAMGGVTNLYIGKLFECVMPCVTGSIWSGTQHIFAGDQRIASRVVGSTDISYYHTDHLGSTSVVTDRTGAALAEYTYRPFGDTFTEAGPHFRYQYTGQEKDSETGLYFYNARYYDARLGRFIQADTIVPDPLRSQGLNRYAYVLNNPLRYTDPTGHLTTDSFGVPDLQINPAYAPPPSYDLSGDLTYSYPASQLGLSTLTLDTTLPTIYPSDPVSNVRPDDTRDIPASPVHPAQSASTTATTSDNRSLSAPASVVISDSPGTLTVDATPVSYDDPTTGPTQYEIEAGAALFFPLGAEGVYSLPDPPVIPFGFFGLGIRSSENIGKTADSLIPGSLKRSPSYHSEYGNMTYGDILKGANAGDMKAKQMKKLIEQSPRLLDK